MGCIWSSHTRKTEKICEIGKKFLRNLLTNIRFSVIMCKAIYFTPNCGEKMFEKDWNISYLLDFYGEILPEKKRGVMELYYNEDLSLAEIAEQIGISRQGVRDIIKKTEEELLFWEEKLGLARRASEQRGRAERILSLLPQEQCLSEDLKQEIRALLEDMR